MRVRERKKTGSIIAGAIGLAAAALASASAAAQQSGQFQATEAPEHWTMFRSVVEDGNHLCMIGPEPRFPAWPVFHFVSRTSGNEKVVMFAAPETHDGVVELDVVLGRDLKASPVRRRLTGHAREWDAAGRRILAVLPSTVENDISQADWISFEYPGGASGPIRIANAKAAFDALDACVGRRP